MQMGNNLLYKKIKNKITGAFHSRLHHSSWSYCTALDPGNLERAGLVWGECKAIVFVSLSHCLLMSSQWG